MKKISIGAAIIAKNEEKNIQNCINSVTPFCQQIVVVDTGSEDGTPIIASQTGAEVYFYSWNDSFSAARNFAVEHIRTDWVISIDTDEVLDYNSFSEFIKNNSLFFKKNNYGGISVILNNYLDKSLQTSSRHQFTRIFRRNKNIRFERKIHEQVADSILNAGFSIFDSEIIINHFGYIEKNMEKIERNRQLLQANIGVGENDFDRYHLANTEFAAGNIDIALNIFNNLKASNFLSEEQKNICKIRIGQIYLQKQEYDKIINELNFKINDIDLEGLRQSIVAVTYLILKDYVNAKLYYQKHELNNSSLVDKSIISKAVQVMDIL